MNLPLLQLTRLQIRFEGEQRAKHSNVHLLVYTDLTTMGTFAVLPDQNVAQRLNQFRQTFNQVRK